MTAASDAAWEYLSRFQWHQRHAVVPVTVIRDMQLLRGATDDVIRAVVVDMRREGASWQEVADALGVSRQAAQQRYRTVTE